MDKKILSSNLNKNNEFCYHQVQRCPNRGPLTSALAPLWPIPHTESSPSSDHINLLFENFWRIPLFTQLSTDSSTGHSSLDNVCKFSRLILTTSLYMSYIPAKLVYVVLPEYILCCPSYLCSSKPLWLNGPLHSSFPTPISCWSKSYSPPKTL